jgi:GDP-L-fucose synthase
MWTMRRKASCSPPKVTTTARLSISAAATRYEISVKDLLETIARLTGFHGRIVWDTSKPNGQPRRRLDTTRAERAFGFRAGTDLATGLARTIAWYRERRKQGRV